MIPIQYIFHPRIMKIGVAMGALVLSVDVVALRSILAPAYFIVLLLAASTLEMFTCYRAKTINQKEFHSWRREILGKLTIIALAVLGMILDVTVYLLANMMPDRYRILATGLPAITITTSVWLITAEGVKIIENVEKGAGKGYIPPPLRSVIAMIRRVDGSRRPSDVDESRWYDGLEELSDEDIMTAIRSARERNSRKE